MKRNPEICGHCYTKRVTKDTSIGIGLGSILTALSLDSVLKEVDAKSDMNGWCVVACPIDHGGVNSKEPVPEDCIYRTEHAVTQDETGDPQKPSDV